jgi:hypothetical protein
MAEREERLKKMRDYMERNKERLRLYRKQWRENNPEKVKAQKQRWNARRRENRGQRQEAGPTVGAVDATDRRQEQAEEGKGEGEGQL